jgi:hypothetical protein
VDPDAAPPMRSRIIGVSTRRLSTPAGTPAASTCARETTPCWRSARSMIARSACE